MSQSFQLDLVLILPALASVEIQKILVRFEFLKKDSANIFVVSPQPQPLGFSQGKWIESSSQSPMQKRWIGFQEAQSDLVLFLDHDNWVGTEELRRLDFLSKTLQRPTLLRGSYRSPHGLAASGRAYNVLCDQWVRTDTRRFLGGAFALWKAPKRASLWEGIQEYGGEEEIFAQRWAESQFLVTTKLEYSAWHESVASMGEFFQRAFRHGRAKNWTASPSSKIQNLFQERSFSEKAWIAFHLLGVALGRVFGRTASNGDDTNPTTLAKA